MTKQHPSSRLSAEERSKLRGEFVAYMDMHPAVSTTPSPYYSYFTAIRAPLTYALVAVFLFGGTAYASEHSLPNDFLYPVKTDVLEPAVLEGASFSQPLKARIAVELVERRLEEADALSERNQLGVVEAEQLAERIEGHIAVVATAAEKTDLTDTDEMIDVGIELEAKLAVHTELLESESALADARIAAAEPISPSIMLATKLRTFFEKADDISAEAEERLIDSLKGEEENYVEARATETALIVESGRDDTVVLPAEEIQEGVATSTEAVDLLQKGKEAQRAGDYDAALASFREAEQVAAESKLLLESDSY